MLDTVLNLGLNDTLVEGLAREDRERALRLGLLPALRADVRQRRRAASRASGSRTRSSAVKADRGVKQDTELDVDALQRARRDASRASTTSRRTRSEQLRQAIRAVFDSWKGERAVEYRRINRIPDDWGTAVNVQQMVFGNKGDTSRLGRRVQPRRGHRRARAVRRLPRSTPRARTSSPACATRATSPSCASGCPRRTPSSWRSCARSRRHYGDMQDTEFTVEEGRLYMLQTRNAKRPAQAAVRFACDAVDEGLLDEGGGDRDDRRREARRAAAPDVRPRRRVRRARQRRRRVAGRGEGRDRLHRRRRRGGGGRRARRHPRAPVHRGRRRRRLPRREGDPHARGRQGLARGARRARHGRARRSPARRRCRSTSTHEAVAVDGTQV